MIADNKGTFHKYNGCFTDSSCLVPVKHLMQPPYLLSPSLPLLATIKVRNEAGWSEPSAPHSCSTFIKTQPCALSNA